jgi:hypothetical protein
MPEELQNPTLPEKVKKGEVNLTVNNITIRSADRTPKDVQTLRAAQQSAENIYSPNRTRLYDLYDDLKMDGHLVGIVGKRIAAVLNKGLHFINAAGEQDDDFDDLIVSKQFRKVITQLMLVKMWGIRGLEFVPGPALDVRIIPVKHIKPKWGIIAKEQSGQEGFNYVGVQNIWVVGEADDFGLYLVCGFYALLKRGDISDWAQYIERFGMPLTVAKYDAFDEQTDVELDRALANAGSSMYLKIPRQAEIELIDGKTSNGDGKLQDGFRTAMNEEMSIAILTNTETTSSSKSSGYAQAKEHGKQQLEVTKTDLVDIAGDLNSPQFLAILKSYGWATDGGKFEYAKEIEVAQVAQQITIAQQAKAMGVPVEDDYIYDITGIPKPENYDELKVKAEADAAAAARRDAGTAASPPPDEEGKNPDENLFNAINNTSAWRRMRQSLADFFDLPRQ